MPDGVGKAERVKEPSACLELEGRIVVLRVNRSLHHHMTPLR